MQNELTPKQQASELIRQAKNILLFTGREPNNDQLSACIAMQRILNRLGKQASIVISDNLPKSAGLYDTQSIKRDIHGIRDFIIDLNLSEAVADKLKYNIEGDKLKITITPLNGNFKADDVSFSHGAYKFDLVIVLGVAQITKLDRIVEQNPTIFDGLHLINIDYHRINEEYGSVNLIDHNSSSVCEILISLFESIEQGLIDEMVATALLAGIMSATSNFTSPSTTPKTMTVAAQMLAAGAKQQQIVKVLFSKTKEKTNEKSEPKKLEIPDKNVATTMREAMEKAKAELAKQKDVNNSEKILKVPQKKSKVG